MSPMDVTEIKKALPPIPFFRIRKRSVKLWNEVRRKSGLGHQPEVLSEFRRNWSARTWIEGLERRVILSGKTEPESFMRRKLAGGLRLYTSGGERSSKILMIAYTGNAQRLMMPLPVFLQHLDSESVDIAVLSDSRRNGYRAGVAGIADTLPVSISAMDGLLEVKQYRKVIAFGTSGGGIPAIITALQLGLDAAMSVGGNSPDDPRWEDYNRIGLRKTIMYYCSTKEKLPKTYLVFGDHSPLDRRKAEALAEIVPATIIAVESPDRKVEHNALFPLVQQGQLCDFLGRTILAGTDLPET